MNCFEVHRSLTSRSELGPRLDLGVHRRQMEFSGVGVEIRLAETVNLEEDNRLSGAVDPPASQGGDVVRLQDVGGSQPPVRDVAWLEEAVGLEMARPRYDRSEPPGNDRIAGAGDEA